MDKPGGHRQDGVADGRVRWLLLIYRVPSEPTRLRAAVWRRLKSLGAIYLQNSVAALPATVGADRALRALRNEIAQDMGGTAQLLVSNALVGEAEIVESFNHARDEEYGQIVQRGDDFLQKVKEQVDSHHYSYAALEEYDDGLNKLRQAVDKVRARDLLGAAQASLAEDMIGRCTQTLNDFAERVYRFDSATSAAAPAVPGTR